MRGNGQGICKFAQIKEFRVNTISEICIQHAYKAHEMKLSLALNPILVGLCNYLYSFPSKDWVDPISLIGLIIVVHVKVGEQAHGSLTYKELLKIDFFFYHSNYILPIRVKLFGHLLPLHLLDFMDSTWPLRLYQI